MRVLDDAINSMINAAKVLVLLVGMLLKRNCVVWGAGSMNGDASYLQDKR